jgi:hypothetical protein
VSDAEGFVAKKPGAYKCRGLSKGKAIAVVTVVAFRRGRRGRRGHWDGLVIGASRGVSVLTGIEIVE